VDGPNDAGIDASFRVENHEGIRGAIFKGASIGLVVSRPRLRNASYALRLQILDGAVRAQHVDDEDVRMVAPGRLERDEGGGQCFTVVVADDSDANILGKAAHVGAVIREDRLNQ
jgi:hypothetical protein